MGKYDPLRDYLIAAKRDTVHLSFKEINGIIKEKLPPSAFEYREWWANQGPSHSQSRSWYEAGFKVRSVNREACEVIFESAEARRSEVLPLSEGDVRHQGAQSNAQVGRIFEDRAQAYLRDAHNLHLHRDFTLDIGTGNHKKQRRFDLGSETPSIIVECKSHSFTKTGNMPSAKMTVWIAEMYYFFLAPPRYRKIFFFKKAMLRNSAQTLGAYFIATNRHLIPRGVEFWEFDEAENTAEIIFES